VILVSDTGPIIALAKIKQLNLLQKVCNEVQIPFIVYKELMAKTGDEENEILKVATAHLHRKPCYWEERIDKFDEDN